MEDEVIYIRDLILANKKPAFVTTNKKEIRVRCPYCGDSKDRSHAHMYIQLSSPFKFYCQKCQIGGRLSNDVLRDLGIYDSNAPVKISSLNNKYKLKIAEKKQVFNIKKFDLGTRDSQTSIDNINYLKNRFGISDITDDELRRFNCITDADSFFKVNGMKKLPINQYDVDNAIGFVSSDSSHIVFRDTSNMQRRRYYNMALTDDEDSASKIYNIKNVVDILNTDNVLVITEGIFDIIGVYLHLYKGKMDPDKNYIFAAACGKSYNAVISHYVKMGFLNFDLRIYSDADVDVSFYRNLKTESRFLGNQKIEVYYNTLEKDYGIPADRINLKKTIIM